MFQTHRDWSDIGKHLKRTGCNVSDKFRTLGGQFMNERVKGVWKLKQLLKMLQLIEQQSCLLLLDKKINMELPFCDHHDAIDEQQRLQRRHCSARFEFHNIRLIRQAIKPLNLLKVDTFQIAWSHISRQLKTKTSFDCRNIIFQYMKKAHRQTFTSLQQAGLIEFVRDNEVHGQVQWDEWSDKATKVEAINRWRVIKKMDYDRQRLSSIHKQQKHSGIKLQHTSKNQNVAQIVSSLNVPVQNGLIEVAK